MVFMGVEDLRDLPAAHARRVQAFLVVQRVDGQSLASLGAGDQVVEVAVCIAGPDAFDDHALLPSCATCRL
jgi:hypothetical protein